MSKAISRKRDFSKITVNGQPLEVLSVLDIEVPVWRDPEKGEVWVYMRPVVEQLGLDWKRQRKKLTGKKARRVFQDTGGLKPSVSPNPTNPEESITREALFLQRKGFLFWLATLQPSRTALSEKLEEFQLEVADALDRYFSEGVAVNQKLLRKAPQAVPQIAQNFSRQVREALSEERRIELLAYLLDYLGESYKERLARVLVAKLTGDSFFLPTPQDLPADLTVWARDKLSREGISLPYEKLRSFAQGMGQRAAKIYKIHYGKPPEKRTQEIGGRLCIINAYYLPKHERILEEAFQRTLQKWQEERKLQYV